MYAFEEEGVEIVREGRTGGGAGTIGTMARQFLG